MCCHNIFQTLWVCDLTEFDILWFYSTSFQNIPQIIQTTALNKVMSHIIHLPLFTHFTKWRINNLMIISWDLVNLCHSDKHCFLTIIMPWSIIIPSSIIMPILELPIMEWSTGCLSMEWSIEEWSMEEWSMEE